MASLSATSFSYSELQALPKELLIEMLRYAATSVPPVEQRADEWAARITEWSSTLGNLTAHISSLPQYVDGNYYCFGGNDWLRNKRMVAFAVFVAADAMPFSVYTALSRRSGAVQHATDLEEYATLMEDRAEAQRRRSRAAQRVEEVAGQ